MPARNSSMDVATVIKDFLFTNCSPDYLGMNDTNERVEDAMRAEMKNRKITSKYLEKTVHLAASLSELAYKDYTFEEKKNIALYNWYILYIDDGATKDVAPFLAFQRRFHSGIPQLDPVLDAFAALLYRLCDQLDPLAANFFLSATFEFINAACVEPAIETLPILRSSRRFPSFLRQRSGLGLGYALLVFSKSHSSNFATCFQALPDMDFWVAGINDTLSFYKEELAGETINYIHNRANVEGREPLQVLLTIQNELLEASANISRILSNTAPAALAAWKDFETGLIAWHLQQDRYKLKNLRL